MISGIDSLIQSMFGSPEWFSNGNTRIKCPWAAISEAVTGTCCAGNEAAMPMAKSATSGRRAKESFTQLRL